MHSCAQVFELLTDLLVDLLELFPLSTTDSVSPTGSPDPHPYQPLQIADVVFLSCTVARQKLALHRLKCAHSKPDWSPTQHLASAAAGIAMFAHGQLLEHPTDYHVVSLAAEALLASGKRGFSADEYQVRMRLLAMGSFEHFLLHAGEMRSPAALELFTSSDADRCLVAPKRA